MYFLRWWLVLRGKLSIFRFKIIIVGELLNILYKWLRLVIKLIFIIVIKYHRRKAKLEKLIRLNLN